MEPPTAAARAVIAPEPALGVTAISNDDEQTISTTVSAAQGGAPLCPVVCTGPASLLMRMGDVTQWLVSVDPALDRVVRESTLEWDLFVKAPFVALVGTVVGTIVRYTQARAVRQALYEHLGGVNFRHEALARLLDDRGAQRSIGLTAKHVAILRALCDRAAQSGPLETAEDVRRLAAGVPGIGAWTKETALITCLLDADAFPSADKWLRRKMAIVYGMAKSPTPKEAEIMARRWSPYRGIAVAYLWRWFDKAETAQLEGTQ
ncbi:DNA-3-methyladenine glycosylase [Pandoravirus kuranda]|uniref:DNA-3-methyladenine glycosylase n=2 Tax=Pandoravirus TaxID=2060084 RepID=A0AA95J3D3_9VIRU|nr:DNA-3-methyladenine glycosylase incomplete domain containing protein [Pandoravirus neocaledonia]AVK75684.1 DNA-3-methyladenine glycosylase incomplete domain containing protein [Pandoravirus neocaledonia]WBR14247.1 DNA-3-methyladenine glycosylase [Pandoravirus kuranda]